MAFSFFTSSSCCRRKTFVSLNKDALLDVDEYSFLSSNVQLCVDDPTSNVSAETQILYRQSILHLLQIYFSDEQMVLPMGYPIVALCCLIYIKYSTYLFFSSIATKCGAILMGGTYWRIYVILFNMFLNMFLSIEACLCQDWGTYWRIYVSLQHMFLYMFFNIEILSNILKKLCYFPQYVPQYGPPYVLQYWLAS